MIIIYQGKHVHYTLFANEVLVEAAVHVLHWDKRVETSRCLKEMWRCLMSTCLLFIYVRVFARKSVFLHIH